jgi:hypothetical protein
MYVNATNSLSFWGYPRIPTGQNRIEHVIFPRSWIELIQINLEPTKVLSFFPWTPGSFESWQPGLRFQTESSGAPPFCPPPRHSLINYLRDLFWAVPTHARFSGRPSSIKWHMDLSLKNTYYYRHSWATREKWSFETSGGGFIGVI